MNELNRPGDNEKDFSAADTDKANQTVKVSISEAKTEDATKKRKKKSKKKKRKPIWRVLRFFLVPFLCLAALFGGLVIGYVYLGEQPLSDVWNIDTWKHVFDLVFANT
ncbi:DNA-directed RNA polymerase subunit beta [Paenibacillus senegalensis]|uniref:DNA-directed RNA polymerase subunit beta n=1 Tax=Paenibacillus senegalensis TaxID=1465766 RepID=UPI000289455C|nr:DNA-directed RNA polymerase subunit beta [Paenibacillus senegalensis]